LKNKYLTLFLLFFIINVFSQENAYTSFGVSLNNSIKLNRFLINPAFSYARELGPSLNIVNKRQWVKFEDSPVLYLINYQGRLGNESRFAIGAYSQSAGLLKNTGGVFNYAYNVSLQKESNLTFGLNLYVSSSAFDVAKAVTQAPEPLLADKTAATFISIKPGINYNANNFDFGISANNIVAYNLSTSQTAADNQEASFSGHLMYTKEVNSFYDILDGSNFSGLIQVENKKDATALSGSLIVDNPEMGWVQAGYNTLHGASAGVGFSISQKFLIGYSYNMAISNSSFFGSSHEFSLSYQFTNYDDAFNFKKRAAQLRKIREKQLGTSAKKTPVRQDKKEIAENQAEKQRAAKEEIERKKQERAEANKERIAQAAEQRKLNAAAIAERQRLAKEKIAEKQLAQKEALKERLSKTGQNSTVTQAEKDRLAKEAADKERLAAAQAEKERLAKEAADKERLAAAQAEKERLAKEAADKQRLATTQAEKERLAKEAADKQRLATTQAEKDRLAKEAADKERLAAAQAEKERLAKEAADKQRLATTQAEKERLAKEAADKQRLAAAQAEKDRLAKEAADKERLAAAQAEKERLAKEAADKERLAAAQAEKDRLAKEAADKQRLAAAQAEKERLAKEAADKQRLAAAQAEKERLAKEAADKQRLAAAQAEKERLAKEAADKERLAAAQAEKERLAKEAADKERLAAAQAEKERLAKEAAEKERLAAAQAEKERLAKEAADKERLAAAQAEKERLAKEAADKERLAATQAEKERLAKEAADKERLAAAQAEKERLAKEAADKQRLAAAQAEKERLAKEAADKQRLAAAQAEKDRLAKEAAANTKLSVEDKIANIESKLNVSNKVNDSYKEDIKKKTKDSEKLIKRLDSIVKERDLDLKAYLNEGDKNVAPRKFVSTSQTNAQLAEIKKEIQQNKKTFDNLIFDFENANAKRLAEFQKNGINGADAKELNEYYQSVINDLKNKRQQYIQLEKEADEKIKKINADKEEERLKRIKKADYDSEEQRIINNQKSLEAIKNNSNNPNANTGIVQNTDKESGSLNDIPIIKKLNGVDSGYYVVLETFKNKTDRNNFIQQVVAEGGSNVTLFYNIYDTTDYVYIEKYSSLTDAVKSLSKKGTKSYNKKMFIVKVE
jgi:type IX secretion system PorP/SprF family membrane protein